jgi:hypothetical protein
VTIDIVAFAERIRTKLKLQDAVVARVLTAL